VHERASAEGTGDRGRIDHPALIENALLDGGCSVVGPVATLGRALKTIEKTDIDAALLDIRISGRDTYPIADVLAARGVPFIFVSGFTRNDLPRRYRHCAHITKPFGPNAIMAALSTQLG
jgi:CheY-like chemotaxis protein